MAEINQLPLYQRMLRERFTASLYDTCKYLLGYKDITWRTHGDMIEVLEDLDCKRKLLVLPRGTFKSSIGVVGYSIWRLMKDPNLRILVDSELYSNSKNFIREIRQHLERDNMTQLFGPAAGTTWGEGEITLAWRTATKKEASITASGIGATKIGQHYDLCLLDDISSRSNTNTDEACKKTIDHYRMTTALLDPGGELVVIGTRYHTNDVIGHILDNEIDHD